MSNDGALLLAIDVGNTNISFGLFDEARALRADWRMETRSGRTADEYFAILSELFRHAGIDMAAVKAVAVSSVVPPDPHAARAAVPHLPEHHAAGRRPGDEDRRARPLREPARGRRRPHRQRGRRARSLAAGRDRRRLRHRDHVRRRHRARRIPGRRDRARPHRVGRRALPRHREAAARRDRPARRRPSARNTVHSMQAGLVFGYAGLVDAIVGRIKAEVDFAPRVVGTGGLAPLSPPRRAASTSATTC